MGEVPEVPTISSPPQPGGRIIQPFAAAEIKEHWKEVGPAGWLARCSWCDARGTIAHDVMTTTVGALHSCPDHALGMVGPTAWSRDPRPGMLEWRIARRHGFRIPPESDHRDQLRLVLPDAIPIARVNVVAWAEGDPLQIQIVPLYEKYNHDLVRDQLVVTAEFFTERDVIGQFTFSSMVAFEESVIHPQGIRDAQVLVGAEVVVVGVVPSRARPLDHRLLAAAGPNDILVIEAE